MACSQHPPSVWTQGPSRALVPELPESSKTTWHTGHVFDKVVVDGRSDLAAAKGQAMPTGISAGWTAAQSDEVTSYAVNPSLQLDPALRAHGGWRGPNACQRGTRVYNVATRILDRASELALSTRIEPDRPDAAWPEYGHSALLHDMLLSERKTVSSQQLLEDTDAIYDLQALAEACKAVFGKQPTVVDVPAPCKVFGDTHGQLRSLLLLFGAFGIPSHSVGDVQAISYIFNGDFVDRGSVHSIFSHGTVT